MTNEFKIELPKLGESIVEATVVEWFKKEGDTVELDEPLLEVSTDKINSEIPSSFAGKIHKIHAKPGQVVKVGELLATISSEKAVSVEKLPLEEKKEETPTSSMEDYFSPAVLRLAKEKGIPMSELDNIPRTGEGGRLTKKDVEAFVKEVTKETVESKESHPSQKIERVKMTALRKAIADNMVRSFYEAPHASIVSEVDVTNVMSLIKKEKEKFFNQHKVKLSITSYVGLAIVKAVQAFPLINASLENDTIVMKRFVNLGIAVSVDQGVMVPVIKHSEKFSIVEMAKAISHLAQKARSHDLNVEDVQDGSITLTNFGMAKALIGIPIIRHPEVAIIGMGAIHKKVAVLEDDSMAIRSVMNLSLTFDHRVLDGMYGCGFLAEVKKHLEEFTP